MTKIERLTEEQLREEMTPEEILESGRRDVEALERATEANREYAEAIERAHEALRQPQDATTGAAAIYGKWPGDESEEELLAALDDIE